MKSDNFIRLYNVLAEEHSQYHLSVDELYIYSLLKRLANYNDESVINIDIVEQFSNVLFRSRSNNNKKHILNTIMSLVDKGVIYTDCQPTKYNELVIVTFADDLQDNNISGHEQITHNMIDNITDKLKFYIFFTVSRWNNNNKANNRFICSYERWSRILNTTTKTAQSYVDECVDDGTIYRKNGDYTDEQVRVGQKKKQSHQYKIEPFAEEELSYNQQQSEKQDTFEPVQDDWGNKYPFDTGNWLISGANLDVNDYVIYLERLQKDDYLSKDFIGECHDKYHVLNKNGTYKYKHDKLVKQAQEQINERNRQHEQDKQDQQEQELIDTIKDNDVVVERRPDNAVDIFDTQTVVLDNFYQLQVNDTLYDVQNTGYEDIKIEHSIKDILTGQVDNDNPYVLSKFSDDVLEELLYKFKELYFNNGEQFNYYQLKTQIDDYRKQYIEQINQDKPFDVFHQGDVFDMEDDRNISLQNRQQSVSPR